MKNSKKKLLLWLLLCAALLAAALSFGLPGGKAESVQEAMRDAVLHDVNRISLFGIKEVNPALISAFSVTGILLLLALILRLFVIPRFTLMLGTFSGMAKSNSPHRHKALGVYLFTAGVYIFSSTLFELFGFQAVTAEGHSIALPAPLSDVNAAIALGCLSYLFIMFGGILAVGPSGIGRALKEFSLPISMSFRLFGALLSGLLVTELVYYYITLSFVLPVIVGVLFTLLHALIQSYVLTMLTALYYGEVTEPKEPKAAAG